ncbi:MAG TPA: hypothetical protein VKE41_00425, partial [Roseiflexaceae bacterium]|nr:hypothetical protein [Roseiflexaceae bacterium]
MWQLDCYLIIPHPAESRVLLLPDTAGWSLPQVHVNVEGAQDEMHLLRPAIRERFGADVTGLRRVYTQVDDQAQRADVIQFLENHSAVTNISAGKWFSREQLAELALVRPEQRGFMAEALAERAGAPPPEQRAPWARPGWFAQAAAWTERQLAQRGYQLAAPVEQYRSSSISCVLRA